MKKPGMEYRTGCLICGKELVFYESATSAGCFYCGSVHETNAICVEHHYICDACHSASADDLIENYCIRTDSLDPIETATRLMKIPSVKMHGPEHHFLVPAVLLACYSSCTSIPLEKRTQQIRQARKRAEGVKGGFCGFYGACGAAIGTGIFMSLITESTPHSGAEWRLCNLVTAEGLAKIAEYQGPRCCKRNSYLAILSAVAFLAREFAVKIPFDGPPTCTFTALNKDCHRRECPFFAKTLETKLE
jgi:hypothetical protein